MNLSNLDHLRVLKDGWLNGDGLAPTKEGLDWLETLLGHHANMTPYIYLTYEGDVRLEWEKEFLYYNTIEIDLVNKSAYYHFLNKTTDEVYEKYVDLTSESGLKFFHITVGHQNWNYI